MERQSINKSVADTDGPLGRVYRDFDISLKPHPATGDLRIKSNVEAVKQSVRNLILTSFGERPFRPWIGSNARSSLFDQMDEITKNEILDGIAFTIDEYEPRFELTHVETREETATALSVTLYGYIKNIPDEQRVNITIKRVR